MWIVRVALNRPYTFVVLALLIFMLSPVVISTRRPTSFRTSTSRSSRWHGPTPASTPRRWKAA